MLNSTFTRQLVLSWLTVGWQWACER